MKKIFLLILLIAASGNAEVRYVSNLGGAPYTTISLAISGSDPGDSIIVAPSVLAYDGFTVDRQITIVGAGTDTISGKATIVSSQIIVSNLGDGTVLSGLWVRRAGNGLIRIQAQATDLSIEGCLFEQLDGGGHGTFDCASVEANCSAIFINCCFWDPSQGPTATYSGISLSSDCTIDVQSCVFAGLDYAIRSGASSSSMTISHSIFNYTSGAFAYTSAYGTIQNSVSIGASMLYNSPNLFCEYCASSGTVPNGEGNMPIVGGEFINIITNNPRRSDYHLSASSPLIDAGNPATAPDLDGSRADIGIYGGQYPYNEFGIPDWPRVLTLDADATVHQNGILHVGSSGRVGP